MHNIDLDLVEMTLDVVKYAVNRIADTNPPLGFPKTEEELSALVGETITLRRIVPPLTNPDTRETATTIERDVVIAHENQLVLNAYRFDYGWEMAEGIWRFQVLHKGEVIAEKAIKVVVPMN